MNFNSGFLLLLLLTEAKIHVPVILIGRSLNNKTKLKTLQIKNRKKVFWQLATDIQEQSFAGVFHKRCSEKFCKIHRKTPVLESLFNKVAGHQACNFIKNRIQHRCFPAKVLQSTSDGWFWILWFYLIFCGKFPKFLKTKFYEQLSTTSTFQLFF